MADNPNHPANVQDAQTVEAKENPTTFDIDTYNAALEIVRRRLILIEQAKQELKKLNDMYRSVFINNELYQKADMVVKEAMKKRKDIQVQISRQAAVADVAAKIKDIKEQIKSHHQSLSQELMEYYRTAGVTEIEDANGNIQEFEIVVKLKPKKKA